MFILSINCVLFVENLSLDDIISLHKFCNFIILLKVDNFSIFSNSCCSLFLDDFLLNDDCGVLLILNFSILSKIDEFTFIIGLENVTLCLGSWGSFLLEAFFFCSRIIFQKIFSDFDKLIFLLLLFL